MSRESAVEGFEALAYRVGEKFASIGLEWDGDAVLEGQMVELGPGDLVGCERRSRMGRDALSQIFKLRVWGQV